LSQPVCPCSLRFLLLKDGPVGLLAFPTMWR
jgi:hypothetical protein